MVQIFLHFIHLNISRMLKNQKEAKIPNLNESMKILNWNFFYVVGLTPEIKEINLFPSFPFKSDEAMD